VDRIARLRQRIDDIDAQLVRLLNERASCALAVGHLKETSGLPLYQPAREAEVLAAVRAANRGPLDAGALTRLFERIIDEARRLERLAAAGRAADGADDAARAAIESMAATEASEELRASDNERDGE
jgi:chorismate mutase